MKLFFHLTFFMHSHINPEKQKLMLLLIRSIILLTISCSAIFAAQPVIEIQHGNDDAIYAIGEKITWLISAKNMNAADLKSAQYSIKRGGIDTVLSGSFDLNMKQALETSLDISGSLLLSVSVKIEGKDRPYVKRSGALIDPENIKASMPRPDDFDKFWNNKLAEQNQVPMNPRLTREKEYRSGVESWKITLDTIRGQKIQGRFSRPKKEGRFPALLIVQSAGVYGLNPDWSMNQAEKGFIVLNIMAHDLPIDKDKAFYQELARGALDDYTHIGNTDRETSYLLRMCLASSRAVDYLSERDDWNGKHILVTGGSQGGYQAIVAAGLNAKVTGIMAGLPAGCDQTSLQVNRAPSWPNWITNDPDNKVKLEVSRYYDAVNFSHNIKCPALIGIGIGDTTSRVEGVLTAVHAMRGPVVTDISPNKEHTSGSFLHYGDTKWRWMNAVAKGEAIPIDE